jgi:hypothetical protein
MDDAKIKAAVGKARKNAQTMGVKTDADWDIVLSVARDIIRTLPDMVNHELNQVVLRDTLRVLLTGDKSALDSSKYSQMSIQFIGKQALYVALELINETTGS